MSHHGIAKLGQKSYLDALCSISHVFLTSSWERLTIIFKWLAIVRPDVLTRVMQQLYRFRTITVESHVS